MYLELEILVVFFSLKLLCEDDITLPIKTTAFVSGACSLIVFLIALQWKWENLLGEKQPKFTETSTPQGKTKIGIHNCLSA